mmetsp:Transcript_72868/g.225087  ORF Transcript_72868/g.225087 Transcript_72868/m.225087 type:complete len:402 (-) Transcript_72868:1201-2406(-)
MSLSTAPAFAITMDQSGPGMGSAQTTSEESTKRFFREPSSTSHIRTCQSEEVVINSRPPTLKDMDVMALAWAMNCFFTCMAGEASAPSSATAKSSRSWAVFLTLYTESVPPLVAAARSQHPSSDGASAKARTVMAEPACWPPRDAGVAAICCHCPTSPVHSCPALCSVGRRNSSVLAGGATLCALGWPPIKSVMLFLTALGWSNTKPLLRSCWSGRSANLIRCPLVADTGANSGENARDIFRGPSSKRMGGRGLRLPLPSATSLGMGSDRRRTSSGCASSPSGSALMKSPLRTAEPRLPGTRPAFAWASSAWRALLAASSPAVRSRSFAASASLKATSSRSAASCASLFSWSSLTWASSMASCATAPATRWSLCACTSSSCRRKFSWLCRICCVSCSTCCS